MSTHDTTRHTTHDVIPQAAGAASAAEPAAGHTRRNLLRLAGALGAGTAVAALRPEVAAAAATWQIGSEANTTSSLTRSSYTGAPGGGAIPDFNAAFEFHSGTGTTSLVGGTESVVAAVAGSDSLIPNALLATTRRRFATAVIATGTEEGSVGVQAESAGVGGVGVVAIASQGVGAIMRGGSANARLPRMGRPRPTGGSGGELVHDSFGQLWFNVQQPDALTPDWRLLASPKSAGGFTAISPTRVYDSRRGTAPIGVLTPGQSRTIDARQPRDVTTGLELPVAPLFSLAQAVAITVTVVSTTGNGWLTVNVGGDTAIKGSSVNWSSTGQVLANSTTSPVNYLGQLTVVCGGSASASTHFLVDVIGYYQ